DFLSKESAAAECSEEIKHFLETLRKSAELLQSQGIEDSIIVNYSISLINESRVKNADLTAAICNSVPQENVLSVQNVISKARFTDDPSARQVRIAEESIFSQ